jgi:cellobiose phosphorylase
LDVPIGIEAILGFHKIGNSLQIDPVISPEWDEFEIRYRFGKSTYFILVRNPDHVSRHVRIVQSDGKQIDPKSIPLVDDGLIHRIEVTMVKADSNQRTPSKKMMGFFDRFFCDKNIILCCDI